MAEPFVFFLLLVFFLFSYHAVLGGEREKKKSVFFAFCLARGGECRKKKEKREKSFLSEVGSVFFRSFSFFLLQKLPPSLNLNQLSYSPIPTSSRISGRFPA